MATPAGRTGDAPRLDVHRCTSWSTRRWTRSTTCGRAPRRTRRSSSPSGIQLLDLNTGVVIRYLKWLGRRAARRPRHRVGERPARVQLVLQGAIASTIQLVTAATFLAIVLGVAVGIVSALRQYSGSTTRSPSCRSCSTRCRPSGSPCCSSSGAPSASTTSSRTPSISWVAITVVALLAGLLWSLAIGGDAAPARVTFGLGLRRRPFAMFAFLQITDWWTTPSIGPIAARDRSASAIAFAITALIDRAEEPARARTPSLTTVVDRRRAVPARCSLLQVDRRVLAHDAGPGDRRDRGRHRASATPWGGPDRGVSARTAALTAILVARDALRRPGDAVWRPTTTRPRSRDGRSRPSGDSTPNLDGDFWIQTLDTFTHLLLPTVDADPDLVRRVHPLHAGVACSR